VDKAARNLYWGGAIGGEDLPKLAVEGFHSSFDPDTNAERGEYPVWNGHDFTLPCLKVQGTQRVHFLTYQSHELEKDGKTERLTLRFDSAAFTLALVYQLYPNGIIGRNSVITAKEPIQLEKAFSASVNLPCYQECEVRYAVGKWARENQLQQHPMSTGILTLQAKRGIPGPQYNPWVALCEKDAGETHGRVWFAALAYSGNWAMHIEKTEQGNTHIVAGVNDFDFAWALQPQQSYTTPVLYIGFSQDGYGAMSHLMHSFVREHILPPRGLRRVLYNSWEATAFDVRVEEQKRLAQKAAQIGCELFVVDDGWFGQRHSDKAGLGDWYVNREKFPNGLSDLIRYVKSLGMDFGIWVEPEAVNPDSDLYRTHPQWAYHIPGVEPMQARNQLSLNITLPEVQAYLKGMLGKLLRENDITFLKWDMNRPLTDMDSPELWSKHVQALYSLWAWLHQEFPHVELETCSGGGGRVELGSLAYAYQSWPSDNTDPYDRLFIQEGYTQLYPVDTMMCWVTESGEGRAPRSLDYRFCSAMCGGLGIGANLSKFTQEELEVCTRWIAQYKRWRPIIQQGVLYRLLSPIQGDMTAVQYVSQDRHEAVVFAFLRGQTYGTLRPPLRLQGLDADAEYAVNGTVYSGKTLCNAGISLALRRDFQSAALYIEKV